MRRLDAVTATATSGSLDDAAAAAVTPEKASRNAAVAEPKHSVSDAGIASLHNSSSSSSSSAAIDAQLQGAVESKCNG
jgi:hypothetical protein